MSETVATKARDLTREALVAGLRALEPAFARDGVTHMTLFGSRARGDNRRDSDVDLMIEVDPERIFSLVEMARIGLAVEDSIGFPASVVLRRSARPAMLAAAARDGLTIF